MHKLFSTALTLLIAVSLTNSVIAQQRPQTNETDIAGANRLYEQGNSERALEAVRAALSKTKDAAENWYYLGLSHLIKLDTDEARETLEKALKLRPDYTLARVALAHTLLLSGKESDAKREAELVLQTDERNAMAHYVIGEALFPEDGVLASLAEADKALALNPDFALALLLKAKIVSLIILRGYPSATKEQLQTLIAQSKETVAQLEAYLKWNLNPPDPTKWDHHLEDLRHYADGNFENFIYHPGDVSKKARILSKPLPQTGAEGMNQKVTLQVVLQSDGKVTNIRTVESTDSRLTRPCIEAARKITFKPAMKDGRPVSQYVRVEYVFR